MCLHGMSEQEGVGARGDAEGSQEAKGNEGSGERSHKSLMLQQVERTERLRPQEENVDEMVSGTMK